MSNSTKSSATWTIVVTVAAAAGVAAGVWWARRHKDAMVKGLDNVLDLCDAAAASLEARLDAFAKQPA